MEKMARRYFAPREARRLCELELSEDRLDCFYRCWTRKEAYLKARGTGLTAKLEAFEVTFLPGVPPALSTPKSLARTPPPGGSSTSRYPTATSPLWWYDGSLLGALSRLISPRQGPSRQCPERTPARRNQN